MKVHAISDLHLDYSENARWFDSLSAVDYKHDILILAGDISDNIQLLEMCFKQSVSKFKHVIFVPGNHDLWIIKDGQKNSIEKFNLVQNIADNTGVCMDTFTVGDLSIVPLLGWYDYSFGQPSPDLKLRWMDFVACRWPEHFTEQVITEYFTSFNEPRLDTKNKMVISCSHFVPRIDVMPDFIPSQHRLVYPALGSTTIETQIRKLNPQIHIYGHSHLNQQIQLNGICYINNAFGTPSEHRIARKKLLCVFET